MQSQLRREHRPGRSAARDITHTQQNVHSGAIVALLEDEPGVPQGPVFPPTRFRVTFTTPGTYLYVCAFHDNLGMDGTVIVLP